VREGCVGADRNGGISKISCDGSLLRTLRWRVDEFMENRPKIFWAFSDLRR
jgi:hypothetical protein